MHPSGRASGGSLAIVTGASSGLGAEIAALLARRRYHLILLARRTELLEQLAGQLSRDACITPLTVDLSVPQAVEEKLAEIQSRGPAEVLVNNAGFGLYRPFLDHSPEDFRRLMEVHYFAAVSAIRMVLPGMVERRRGHVINIASMSAKMGPWGHAGYAAAKSALATLTQTLAAEHRGTGVHFTYVNPGIGPGSCSDYRPSQPTTGVARASTGNTRDTVSR